MKRVTLLIIAAVMGLTTSLTPLLSATAHASQHGGEGTGQALEIAPPVVTLSLDRGQTITTTIKLRDVSRGPLVVTGEINDFVAAGEDGTPKILMDDDEAAANNPYSMKAWIDPLARLTLEPGEVQDLPVTIRVPANAAPGGYYGVVRFTATPPELEGTGVSLSASLGSLLLVRVKGKAKEAMQIEEFFVSQDDQKNSLFNSTPVDFITRVKNSGNVHLQPVGKIIVKDMFGRTVAGVNVNLNRSNVLPDSIRRFEAALNEAVIGKKVLFGRYTAELTMTYGANNQTIKAKTSFWVVPYKLIGVIVVALIVGFFVLRTMLRRYNQRIISQAQKNRRRR